MRGCDNMEYNARVKQYLKGTQITLYSKKLERDRTTTAEEKKINERFTKAFKNVERPEEEKERCLLMSIKKTKNLIYDIARSNKWEWFITLTFDRKLYNSADIDEVLDELSKYMDRIKKYYCPNLKYLIVPELHKDGEHYHFHGLFSDCGKQYKWVNGVRHEYKGMTFIYSGQDDYKSGRPIYNMPQWKCGWATATEIGDSLKASAYITKYMTKECVCVLENRKRYYTSHNVDRPQTDYITTNINDIFEQFGEHISYSKTVNISYTKQPYNDLQIRYFELNNIGGLADDVKYTLEYEQDEIICEPYEVEPLEELEEPRKRREVDELQEYDKKLFYMVYGMTDVEYYKYLQEQGLQQEKVDKLLYKAWKELPYPRKGKKLSFRSNGKTDDKKLYKQERLL